MKQEFELPDVGEGVAEGELVTWHVDVGADVEEDQLIAEVETDKALVEIPSPYDGEVAELRAEEGEVVPVGNVLVVFDVDGASSDEETAPNDEVAANTGTDAPGSDEETDREPSAASSDAAEVDGSIVPDGRVFAPPSVRRLAREEGVDLASIRGAASGTRIAERDVREAARGASSGSTVTESASATEAAALESAPSDPEAADTVSSSSTDRVERDGVDGGIARRDGSDRDLTLAMPATRRLAREGGVSIDDVPASEERDGHAFVTPDDVSAYAAGDRPTAASTDTRFNAAEPDGPSAGDRIPYTGVRRTIGEQMSASKYTAPHVSHHDEVEVSELVDARTRLRETAEKRGVSLTYMPFAVKAAVAALQSVPSINARLDEEREEIVLHDEYNVGIAVASDAGLMVPVIENADRKGLLELAREIDDKATRARDRSITLEEMQGGTFTITNVGAIGGEYASPIINYPEAGILALGSLKERPWADGGEVVARPTLPISMSVDHRIVDGAEAAQFTNEVKRYLNTPELLLLE